MNYQIYYLLTNINVFAGIVIIKIKSALSQTQIFSSMTVTTSCHQVVRLMKTVHGVRGTFDGHFKIVPNK